MANYFAFLFLAAILWIVACCVTKESHGKAAVSWVLGIAALASFCLSAVNGVGFVVNLYQAASPTVQAIAIILPLLALIIALLREADRFDHGDW